ncbi:response regulator transcription factor [Arthrobacter cupressi]|uniref:DNA-binding response regulator, NarL/FixJ family, contains REC and HTH domains n=1 Tax=Arthrobacter cupressi TaxID=1045773 RepID=A0A1G8M608_9MICC|nr:response regulator transcription factor [Arthrobacter cupressi]NYD79589.1 DNA-binding NarL/FixJ family response regulator [Arthrobacter cupressi]SDI63374.1 DNA-binding response regulator, NarL/FixJ family, contains REC and HTH domains [Arthrobacter cupressi]
MTKLLIVDDEPLVRSGLRAILEGEPGLEVVGEAGDGAEVPALAARLRPDVVLMDVRMPGIDGIQATRLLLEGRRPVDAGGATAGPKVLVLTTFGSDDYVYAALRCGASGFLLKRSRPEEIIQAVRTVASGDSVVFPEAVRQLTLPGHDGAAGRLLGTLSAREKDVLTELAAGRNNAEIASALYLSPETVKSHVASLLGKLRVRDRTQAVILAYETGFIRPGTRPSGG